MYACIAKIKSEDDTHEDACGMEECETNEETGKYYNQEDGFRISNEQTDNKEEFHDHIQQNFGILLRIAINIA